jgi:hypothetical protein
MAVKTIPPPRIRPSVHPAGPPPFRGGEDHAALESPVPSARSRWLHWLLFAVILYSGFEALCELGLRAVAAISRHDYRVIDAQHLTAEQRSTIRRVLTHDLGYLQHDPLLGWSIQHLGYGPDGLYRSNDQGLRADTDVRPLRPRHGLRVAAFGDSFTHGDEVALADTWEEQLVQSLRAVEVLNFGVPGYGVDQAFLRYQRDGVPFQPDVVLIGFMAENVYRHLNVFRPFYYPDTGVPLAKPRYRLVDGQLELLPNPLARLEDYGALLGGDPALWARLAQHDEYADWRPAASTLDRVPSNRLVKYLRAEVRRRADERQIGGASRYNADGEAFQLTAALLRRFAAAARSHGSVPIIVTFPERQDVTQVRATGTTRYAGLVETLKAEGYQVIDLIDSFRDASPLLEEFAVDHYSPFGNAKAARQIQDHLIRVTIPQIIERRFIGTPPERPFAS